MPRSRRYAQNSNPIARLSADMSKKLKKELIFLIVVLVFFLASVAVFHFVSAPWYIEAAVFAVIYALSGCKVVIKAIKKIAAGQLLDEDFLMTVASIGGFVIGEFSEAVAVMVFFRFGDWFERYAVGKSRKSIAALMDIRPQTANVIRNGEEVTVFPEEIEVGDVLIVRAGEKIAVDGVVIGGAAALDTRALTGESVPRDVKEGDEVLSGCIPLGGVIRVKAKQKYEDSTVAKILDLVENATSKKAKSERFVTAFARVYTPIVVGIAALVGVIPSLITGNWLEWIFKALTFLVVSCPCAIVISVPLSFFGGIGAASANGILIKGSNCIEALAKSGVFVFDKTGTITKGEFVVTKVVAESNYTQADVLGAAAACETGSLHPIALSVLKAAGKAEEGYEITEIAGKGLKATKGGDVILCGNLALMRDNSVQVGDEADGVTCVYVAKNGVYMGRVECEDELKPTSAEAISSLNKIGKTVMLTGDNARVAEKVSASVGVSETFSSLLPGQKVERIERLAEAKSNGETLVFAGDGINDAPSLVTADVGVAMGGKGSNVAVESADVVLMYDDLLGVVKARKIARKTMRIVKENIVFALGVKIAVMLITALWFANMWLAVFADVGVSLIAILNAMRCGKK